MTSLPSRIEEEPERIKAGRAPNPNATRVWHAIGLAKEAWEEGKASVARELAKNAGAISCERGHTLYCAPLLSTPNSPCIGTTHSRALFCTAPLLQYSPTPLLYASPPSFAWGWNLICALRQRPIANAKSSGKRKMKTSSAGGRTSRNSSARQLALAKGRGQTNKSVRVIKRRRTTDGGWKGPSVKFKLMPSSYRNSIDNNAARRDRARDSFDRFVSCNFLCLLSRLRAAAIAALFSDADATHAPGAKRFRRPRQLRTVEHCGEIRSPV